MRVGEEFEAMAGRLDTVVADRLSLTRADAQRAIAGGRVLVDGALRPKSHRLAGGERVFVDLTGMGDAPPEGPSVEIRYRDPSLLIVSKPAGLPTHPTVGRLTGTLVNRLIGMGLPLSSEGRPLRPGIVHRLDAGTSGLLIVASTDQAHQALTAMLRRHEVDRRYLALVRGAVEHDRFAVDAPLGRVGSRIRVRSVTGREAETRFEVRDRFDRATLLEAAPTTGRTHQIRVHLSAVGHPVLGDRAYGGGGDDAKRLGLTRPFLHSWRLSFDHPITGARIEVEDPLPPDLILVLRRVGGEG
ncbi:MAG TPA: RluA family pseudouridine synthase [Actinomycetota bacterium]|nr:RluA family pseudouridine synthase [Actinomycetota bacterium]